MVGSTEQFGGALQLDALTVPKFGATAAADTATACKGRHRDTNTVEKTGNPGKGTGTGARLGSSTRLNE